MKTKMGGSICARLLISASFFDQYMMLSRPVPHLTSTLDVYQNQPGLELLKRDTYQGVHQATFAIGKGRIDLLSPDGEGLVQQIITEKGEGPFGLSFAVKNLEQSSQFLLGQGIKFVHKTEAPEKLTLDVPHFSILVLLFVSTIRVTSMC